MVKSSFHWNFFFGRRYEGSSESSVAKHSSNTDSTKERTNNRGVCVCV